MNQCGLNITYNAFVPPVVNLRKFCEILQRFLFNKFIDFMPEAPPKTENGVYLSETDFTAEQLKIKPRIGNKNVFSIKEQAHHKHF